MPDIVFSLLIKDILCNSEANDKFLLLSVNSTQIIWVVKVKGNEREFWDLIQLSLPYGLTIKGIAMNKGKDAVVNGLYLVNKKTELERREMVSDCFWIISFEVDKKSQSLAVSDNSIEIDFNNFLNSREQSSLKNARLLFNNDPIDFFNQNYVKMHSVIRERMSIDDDIEDRDVLIQQIGIKISGEKEKQDWKLNQRRYGNYVKDNSSSIECCFISRKGSEDASIDEEVIQIRSSVKINSKDKQFLMSINALFSKTISLKDLIPQYRAYAKYLLIKMLKLNSQQEALISSYSIDLNSLSLNISLIYSVPTELRNFTSSLNSQSNYYKDIFSINDFPCIAYSYLANHLNYSSSWSKSAYLSTDSFMNVHQYLKGNEGRNVLKGDYLVSLCHFEDKSFGSGYRAIQTAISWFFFNNSDQYPHLTIPTIDEIKQALILLEEKSSEDIDKDYDINVTQVSQGLSMLIDIQCEVGVVYTSQLKVFRQNLNEMYSDGQNGSSPIIISTGKNAFFTIIGYDINSNEMLVISHEFIGKISLIALLKANTIKWISLEQFFNGIKRFNYLKFSY